MLNEFLKEVVATVVGKQYEKLAELLDGKKYINEFVIAKKLDITINQTRNLLYRLSEQGLVSYERKKDRKKGWYTYYWRIERLKSLEFLRGILLRKIENLDKQIESRENKTYYYSEVTGVEYTEEVALAHDFICPESGQLLVIRDNTKALKELKKAKERFVRNTEEIYKEVKIERDKIDKEKDKARKKEEKSIAKKKAEKRAERKQIKDAAKIKSKVKPAKKISKVNKSKKKKT